MENSRKCFVCEKEKPMIQFLLLCGKYSVECHGCKSERRE